MMKKWLYITAVLLISAGLMIGGIAMDKLDWDFKKLDTENGEWNTWKFEPETIQEISVSGSNIPVNVQVSDDPTIHVLVYNTKTLNIQPEQQGDKLNITAKSTQHLFSFHMFRGIKAALNGIILQIPRGFAGDIQVENRNGSIRISEISGLKNVSIDNQNGSITAEEISADSLTVTNSNGSIYLEQVSARGTLQTKNSNGSTKIEEVSVMGALFQGQNGRILLEEVTAADSIRAENSNGSIRIEDIFAPQLSFVNGNGSIKGTIAGRKTDFRVAANIQNGSSNLNSEASLTRPYLLEVENQNGSCKIAFSR